MSDNKQPIDKTPQILQMLNTVNMSLTGVQRDLLALEKHGHTHPGDLQGLAVQVGTTLAVLAQLTAYHNRQLPPVVSAQVEPGELPLIQTRSDALAAGAKDMAEGLVKYVEGVDLQRKALQEHETMTPNERAKKYKELIVSFFDPKVCRNGSGVLKPGFADLALFHGTYFEMLSDGNTTTAFYKNNNHDIPECLFISGKTGTYILDFTDIEEYFEMGHFYVVMPVEGELKLVDLSTITASLQNQVLAKILDEMKDLVAQGLNVTA